MWEKKGKKVSNIIERKIKKKWIYKQNVDDKKKFF